MNKLERGYNPCPYISVMQADEKGEITIPPKGYKITIAPLDVKNNLQLLPKVDKYKYKEINGKVYRISEKGLEYPPISKEQFQAIKKLHKEYFEGQKEEDEKEH